MLGRSEGRGVKERKKERKKESTTPTPSRNQKQAKIAKKGNEFNGRETTIKNLFWICIFA
jgi:hypothetical protein